MELLQRAERLLWGGPLLVLLMGSHLYFTLRLRGIQRLTLRGIRLSLHTDPGETGVSAFGALSTSLAAAIGTGNIIGIASAVVLGGPGAVFWCWMTGVLGMATRFAETALCLRHRTKNGGGPMYVMAHRMRRPGLGKCFAALGVAAALSTGSMIQANAIGSVLRDTAHVPLWVSGLLLTFGAGAVILGGVKSIARVSEKLVPAMSALYLGGCLGVLILCRGSILPALGLILRSAFTGRAAGGGIFGGTVAAAMRYGTARGLFTNEAGMGTAPIAAAAGPGTDIPREALISMTGVFWDTVVICAVTGVTLVAAMLDAPELFRNAEAGNLCALAFSRLPLGQWVLAVSLTVFAFATVVGWCCYGEACWGFLTRGKRIPLFRGLYLLAAFLGVFLRLEAVWSLGGILAGLMAVPNLIMLLSLRSEAAESAGRL